MPLLFLHSFQLISPESLTNVDAITPYQLVSYQLHQKLLCASLSYVIRKTWLPKWIYYLVLWQKSEKNYAVKWTNTFLKCIEYENLIIRIFWCISKHYRVCIHLVFVSVLICYHKSFYILIYVWICLKAQDQIKTENYIPSQSAIKQIDMN